MKTQRAVQSEVERFAAEFDDKVQMLISMGFAAQDAKMCLTHYNNDLNRAAARLLYGYDMTHVQKRAQAHAPYTSLDPPLQKLMSLGVSKTTARAALRQCNGDIDKAIATVASSRSK